MIAAESGNVVPVRSDDTVIYPQPSPGVSNTKPAGGGSSGGSRVWLAGALLLAMGGGWMLLRRRGLPLRGIVRNERLIVIEETKSLGSRQYLVVARCEGRRFFLGVSTGRIQLLSPLDDHESEASEKS